MEFMWCRFDFSTLSFEDSVTFLSKGTAIAPMMLIKTRERMASKLREGLS
jgi:hypothetical protein